jgi:hypothetical protein
VRKERISATVDREGAHPALSGGQRATLMIGVVESYGRGAIADDEEHVARSLFRCSTSPSLGGHASSVALRFVSLMLAEGRNVLDVAGQAGHAPSLTYDVYGHPIADLDTSEKRSAEDIVFEAREAGVRYVCDLLDRTPRMTPAPKSHHRRLQG